MLYAKQALTLIFALASQFHVYLPCRDYEPSCGSSLQALIAMSSIIRYFMHRHISWQKRRKRKGRCEDRMICRHNTSPDKHQPQPRLWTQTGASPALMGSNHLRSTLLFWPGMYLYVRNKYYSSLSWCPRCCPTINNDTGRGKKGKSSHWFCSL